MEYEGGGGEAQYFFGGGPGPNNFSETGASMTMHPCVYSHAEVACVVGDLQAAMLIPQ